MSAHLPCDCLNFCGDDPRMAKGTVQPCSAWLATKARELEAVRLGDVQRTTGYAADPMGTLQELQRLRGERGAMASLLNECASVLAELEPEEDTEAEKLDQLHGRVVQALLELIPQCFGKAVKS